MELHPFVFLLFCDHSMIVKPLQKTGSFNKKLLHLS